ncbi:hypothetical protein [Streptomyces sp. NPDC059018]|uniref:hypothetical protein n=1 Tax=Streptomyces sp. NPDC059018 TaxID=3346701 RepID=UPI0036C13D8F
MSADRRNCRGSPAKVSARGAGIVLFGSVAVSGIQTLAAAAPAHAVAVRGPDAVGRAARTGDGARRARGRASPDRAILRTGSAPAPVHAHTLPK